MSVKTAKSYKAVVFDLDGTLYSATDPDYLHACVKSVSRSSSPLQGFKWLLQGNKGSVNDVKLMAGKLGLHNSEALKNLTEEELKLAQKAQGQLRPSEFLKPDPVLAHALYDLKAARITPFLMTQSSEAWAKSCTRRLGISDYFPESHVICRPPRGKMNKADPQDPCYAQLSETLTRWGVPNPADTLVIDDTLPNLLAANKLGYDTAKIGFGSFSSKPSWLKYWGEDIIALLNQDRLAHGQLALSRDAPPASRRRLATPPRSRRTPS